MKGYSTFNKTQEIETQYQMPVSCYIHDTRWSDSISNSCHIIAFTFRLIPLEYIWTLLSTQLWVKQYHFYPSTRMELALNSQRRLICFNCISIFVGYLMPNPGTEAKSLSHVKIEKKNKFERLNLGFWRRRIYCSSEVVMRNKYFSKQTEVQFESVWDLFIYYFSYLLFHCCGSLADKV